MKTRTTFLLLIVAAGLFAFIKLYEGNMPGTREATEREQYVVAFDPEKITGFNLSNKEGRIEARKKAGEWRLEKPLSDRADAAAVGQLLDAIQALKKDASLEAKEEQEKEFGISKSDIRLKLLGDGAPPELLIGFRRGRGGQTLHGAGRLENGVCRG